ncbi:hypothetical protein RN001_012779 [Aquatica leii]|uniref:Uncharacterized protein n=1 Tax=Aquatica leii TaxID=1421715 RepID=A0AAN7P4E3_9COLE|nr:hypothetical protein RN001_012779 [Aquatica leii]
MTLNNSETTIIYLQTAARATKKKGFLHRIVTGDKKWMRYNNPKHRKAWVKSGEPSRSTAKPNIHSSKLMLCIWWDQLEYYFMSCLNRTRRLQQTVANDN